MYLMSLVSKHRMIRSVHQCIIVNGTPMGNTCSILTVKVDDRWLNLYNFTIIKNTQFTSKNVEILGSRSGRKQLIIIYDLWCCPPLVTGPRNICNEIHCRTSSTLFYRVKKTYYIYKKMKLLKY